VGRRELRLQFWTGLSDYLAAEYPQVPRFDVRASWVFGNATARMMLPASGAAGSRGTKGIENYLDSFRMRGGANSRLLNLLP
jgi:hypothetical protein